MAATVSELRALPLFSSLSDESLAELSGLFHERRVNAGEVLFKSGDVPDKMQVLVEGELEVQEAGEPKLLLRPPASVGELGSLTGVPRFTTVSALTSGRLLEARTSDLFGLFARSSATAVAFYKALLEVVANKVRRDRGRIGDMRENLVRAQKKMKDLREIVLSSAETSISQPACDVLDELIEHNRRGHYRVVPTPGHAAVLRFDDRSVRVVELSEGYLKVETAAGLAVGAETSGVLVLPQAEIAVSGRVERVGPDGILIKLDLLIEEYKTKLLGYLTQLQLLDFVL